MIIQEWAVIWVKMVLSVYKGWVWGCQICNKGQWYLRRTLVYSSFIIGFSFSISIEICREGEEDYKLHNAITILSHSYKQASCNDLPERNVENRIINLFPTNPIIILNIKKYSGKCGARHQEKNIFNAFSIFWKSCCAQRQQKVK